MQAETSIRPDSHSRGNATQAEAKQLAVDGRIDIGNGLRLHILCEGSGSPLVVFDSGLGEGAAAWANIQHEVAQFTRCCAYDRASRGTSDPATRPHSNMRMAQELHALLTRAGEPGPYVLVGHSMGGINAQLFLAQYQSSVAGMVLVDASPEPPPLDQVPPQAKVEFERNIADFEGLDVPTLLQGFKDLETASPNLGDKPLVILVAGKAPPDPNFSAEQRALFLQARQHAQQSLIALSTNSVLVNVPDSAHHIPHESPATVIRAVRSTIAAARTGSKVPDALVQ